MLKETGTVVGVEEDGLWVETMQTSACQQCSARSGCGQRLLASSVAKNMSQIKAYFSEQPRRLWSMGDHVEIGISDDMLVTATLIAYMLPLLLMVAAAFLAWSVVGTELASMLGAVFGLLLGGFFSRWHAFKNKGNCRYHAVVLESPPYN